MGYGTFAKHIIPKGTLLCEYTGLIGKATSGLDYSWTYPLEINNKKLFIDS